MMMMMIRPTTMIAVSKWIRVVRFLTPMALVSSAAGNPFSLQEPSHDRWFYPSNSTPGTRPQASTFSALPAASGVDDRWAFLLVAFDTRAFIPPGLEPHRYHIQSMRVTARIGQDGLFRYDPTADAWSTYATPDAPATMPDADPGRPLELFGAGFRNGFTTTTFTESSPYGGSAPGTRNAYPLGFDAAANPRDVSHNITTKFDPAPWAVGHMDLTPGTFVPEGTVVTFNLDATQPGVAGYMRAGLAAGRLWFAITSLHPALFQDGEFVSYHTRDGVEHILFGDAAPTWTAEIEIDHPLRIGPDETGENFELTWPQAAGFTYIIQSSDDPTHDLWAPIHTSVADADGNGKYLHRHEDTGGRRFFRLAIIHNQP